MEIHISYSPKIKSSLYGTHFFSTEEKGVRLSGEVIDQPTEQLLTI